MIFSEDILQIIDGLVIVGIGLTIFFWRSERD
jgi:hypothetical protein